MSTTNVGSPGERGPNQHADDIGTDDRWSPWFLLDILRRRMSIVIATIAVALLLATIFVLATPPRYTANVAIVTDTKRAPLSPTDTAQEAQVDPAVVESQLETLRSDGVALAVIDRLGLINDPEFVPESGGLLTGALASIGLIDDKPVPDDMRRQIALGYFHKNMNVVRAGRSYVAQVTFTSLDPQKAADVANAIAEAYMADQLDAKLQNARRTSAWMQQRIDELRVQSSNALRELEEFKSSTTAVADPKANLERFARMRELEVASQAYRTIFETFLNRYTQTFQEQAFPATDARIVTRAVPPFDKSYPRTGTIFILALLAGSLLGSIGAFAREFQDRVARRPEQLERELGVRVLGSLPRLVEPKRPVGVASAFRGALPQAINSPSPKFFRGYGSREAETIRRIQLAIDRQEWQGPGHVIAVVSARNGEGKTTIATNLAAAAVEAGQRVLLIEANLRTGSPVSSMLGNSNIGLPELLANGPSMSGSIQQHERGFHVMGGVGADLSQHPADLLASRAMALLVAQCRKLYGLVIIDTPALLHSADVEALAPHVDHFVLVAQAGRTRIDEIDEALRLSDVVASRLIGLVLNRVEPPATSAPVREHKAVGVLPFELRPPKREASSGVLAEAGTGAQS